MYFSTRICVMGEASRPVLAIILLSLTFLFFFATFACYFVAFYIGKKKIYKDDEYDIPPGNLNITSLTVALTNSIAEPK